MAKKVAPKPDRRPSTPLPLEMPARPPGTTGVYDVATGEWKLADRAEWAARDAAERRALRERLRLLMARLAAQQIGNARRREERTERDPEVLEAAVRRHRAGEKWDAIAPDYGISGETLRRRVRQAGLKGRGHR